MPLRVRRTPLRHDSNVRAHDADDAAHDANARAHDAEAQAHDRERLAIDAEALAQGRERLALDAEALAHDREHFALDAKHLADDADAAATFDAGRMGGIGRMGQDGGATSFVLQVVRARRFLLRCPAVSIKTATMSTPSAMSCEVDSSPPNTKPRSASPR